VSSRDAAGSAEPGARSPVVGPDGAALWALGEPSLDLTVVVPYYNPGRRLRPNLERLVEVLDATGASYEVVAVSDGSTDGSPEDIHSLAGIRRVALEQNQGKGEALRVGLATGRGRYLGFIDADGDLAPEVMAPLVTLMRLYEPDVILGSKRHPMSDVVYPPLRRMYSWGYQQLIRALFRLNVRDTQTGVKLVRREVLAAVLPLMVEKRFAFDLELFIVARHRGYRSFFEAPVVLRERFTSTINPRAVVLTLVDTLAIYARLRLLRRYGAPSVAPARKARAAARPAGSR
jgi:glycosyltransferase involved in cell wall biosynthesis